MYIQFDSDSWRRAEEKAYRLLPDMFKPLVRFRAGHPYLCFRVVGSLGVVYEVVLYRNYGDRWACRCSCRAGQNNLLCYHVAAAYRHYIVSVSRGDMWSISALPLFLSGGASAPLFYFARGGFCRSVFFSWTRNTAAGKLACGF